MTIKKKGPQKGSPIRMGRNHVALIKFYEERMKSPVESIRAEAGRNLLALLTHIDTIKVKREARAFRLELAAAKTVAQPLDTAALEKMKRELEAEVAAKKAQEDPFA